MKKPLESSRRPLQPRATPGLQIHKIVSKTLIFMFEQFWNIFEAFLTFWDTPYRPETKARPAFPARWGSSLLT